MLQGPLRINPKSYKDSYVPHPVFTREFLVRFKRRLSLHLQNVNLLLVAVSEM